MHPCRRPRLYFCENPRYHDAQDRTDCDGGHAVYGRRKVSKAVSADDDHDTDIGGADAVIEFGQVAEQPYHQSATAKPGIVVVPPKCNATSATVALITLMKTRMTATRTEVLACVCITSATEVIAQVASANPRAR